MSDNYKVGSVSVTALGGGWYQLEHSSISEPQKVHGKEAADAAATKLDGTGDGHMQAQGEIGTNTTASLNAGGTDDADKRTAAEKVQERDAGLPEPTPPTPPAQPPVADPEQTAKDNDEIAKLKEQLAAANDKNAALEGKTNDFEARFNEFLKSAQPLVQTVQKAEGEDYESAHGTVPLNIPREYSGQMDPKVKATLKKAGIEVITIVLEENESIPPTGLFVGHNGRSYMITPGEEVDVPDFLIGVLDDAVMSAPFVDSKTQKVLGYRNRSKYPYRVVK